MKESILAKLFYTSAFAYDFLNSIVHFPDFKRKRFFKINISQHGGNILELCCGTGQSSHIFKNAQGFVVNMDINQGFVRYGHKRKRFANPIAGNAYSLSFCDGVFDTVVMPDAFHHVLYHEKLFSECSRVLKSGGEFIIFDIVNKTKGRNEIINHFADGIIWDLDRQRFKEIVERLSVLNNLEVSGYHEFQEKSFIGLVLGGIDIQARMIKKPSA